MFPFTLKSAGFNPTKLYATHITACPIKPAPTLYAMQYFLSNTSAMKPPPLPYTRLQIPQMIPFSPGYSLTDKPPCHSSAPEINNIIEDNCTMFCIISHAPVQHSNSVRQSQHWKLGQLQVNKSMSHF